MNFAPRNEQKAHVAELVDALDSGSSISNDVEVRALSCVFVDISMIFPIFSGFCHLHCALVGNHHFTAENNSLR